MTNPQPCIVAHIPLTIDPACIFSEPSQAAAYFLELITPGAMISPALTESLIQFLRKLSQGEYGPSSSSSSSSFLTSSSATLESPPVTSVQSTKKTPLPIVQINPSSCCWWCCHSFEGEALSLPHSLIDEAFHVSGCFCSFGCALAYNYSMRDWNVSHRTNLLVMMYRQYSPSQTMVPAPPRESLKMFGGWMDIDEFRAVTSTIRVLAPPIQSLMYMVEVDRTKPPTLSSYPKPNAFVPLDGTHVNRARESLRLKRSAPKKTQYVSMEETMGLVIRRVGDGHKAAV